MTPLCHNTTMTLLATGDILRTRAVSHFENHYSYTLLHHEVQLLVGTPVLADLMSNLCLTISTALQPLSSNLTTWDGIRCRRIHPGSPSAEEILTCDITLPGSPPIPRAPDQLAAVAITNDGFASRTSQGRIFSHPLPASAIGSDTLLSQSFFEAWEAAVTTLSTPFVVFGLGFETALLPVIWHRASQTATQIVGVKAHRKIGTQRRRGKAYRPTGPPF
jgi:hypothetical protein